METTTQEIHVNERLAPEIIQRIVRDNFGGFRACYGEGLKRHPDLQGRVSVKFVIATDGQVSDALLVEKSEPFEGVVRQIGEDAGGTWARMIASLRP